MPNTATWASSDLQSLLNGYSSNSFGIVLTAVKSIDLKDITIKVDYTYEEEV
jgi:hypothetical protein